LLTNHLKGATSPAEAASAFAKTFGVAWALVLLTLVPALMLPRRRQAAAPADEEATVPVVLH
jgi:hypothetical protein